MEDLLTSSQVGALIGRSGRTVARMADRGDIPIAQRLPAANGLYLFRREDIDTYLAGRALLPEQRQGSAA